MLSFKCPQCQVALKVTDDKAGQKGKCPKCQAPLVIPLAPVSQAKVPTPTAPPPTSAAAPTSTPPAPAPAASAPRALGGGCGMILGLIVVVFGGVLIRTACSEMQCSRSNRYEAMPTSQDPAAALAALPKDGLYSEPEGSGGRYRDPINGFFEVEPPDGYEIVEKRDKATFTTGPDSPRPGQTVPRSWVVFRRGKVEISAIARKTFSSLEQDWSLVEQETRAKFKGIDIHRTRFIKIDGHKGGELVASYAGMQVVMLKYKKHGLDHAFTLVCPAGEFSKCQGALLAILRSYRSVEPTPAPPSGKP